MRDRSKGVRLRLNEAGGLAMTIDVPHSGDSIIRRENLPVLIVDARLATRLAQRVLDFPAASGRGFALGWRVPASKSTRGTHEPRRARGYDIFSLLLKNRIVFLGTPIDDVVANLIVAQLLYLAPGGSRARDPERVAHDINRDYWVSANEAREYGVIDTIVGQTEATAAADRAEAMVQVESPEIPRKSTNGKRQ